MNINWQNLCYQMEHAKFHSEPDIEEKFSQILDMLFGWHVIEKKLKRQVPVPVGHETKYPDIVLCKDREGIVIEMKGPGVEPTGHYIDQLKSYMKLLGNEYGMIVNDKHIWLYHSQLGSTQINEVAVIPFSENQTDGEELVSILMFDEFSISKLDAFRERKYREYLDRKKAEELLNRLCDGENGKQLVINALLSDGDLISEYGEEAVSMALGRLLVNLSKKKDPVSPPPGGKSYTTFTGFVKKGLKNGTIVHFKGDPSITAEVCGDKELLFEGETYKLSSLAKMLYIRINKVTPTATYHGAAHFLYNGVPVLNLKDIK